MLELLQIYWVVVTGRPLTVASILVFEFTLLVQTSRDAGSITVKGLSSLKPTERVTVDFVPVETQT